MACRRESVQRQLRRPSPGLAIAPGAKQMDNVDRYDPGPPARSQLTRAITMGK
jgi:hypothetical protein